jgi:hypothetical protein
VDISFPGGWLVQWHHCFAGQCLSEAVGVALGGEQTGVVQEPTVAVARVLGMIESKPLDESLP